MRNVAAVLGMVFSMTALASAEDKQAAEKAVDVTAIFVQGADSDEKTRQYIRCTTKAEWEAIWKKHAANDHENRKYRSMIVDFEKNMVIAIFDGELHQRTGTYALKVEELRDFLRIRCDPGFYQVGLSPASTTGVVRTPEPAIYGYCFIVIPKNKKNIVIEYDMKSLINGPPKWVEHHRFEAIRQ